MAVWALQDGGVFRSNSYLILYQMIFHIETSLQHRVAVISEHGGINSVQSSLKSHHLCVTLYIYVFKDSPDFLF